MAVRLSPMDEKTTQSVRESSPPSDPTALSPQTTIETGDDITAKRTLWQRVKEPGSVWQIIIAALLAIAIGLSVSTTVDEVPDAAIAIIGIPGTLWLRALQAVGRRHKSTGSAFKLLIFCLVLPMIVTAMILAIQRLREMSKGGAVLARWTIGYYVLTTLIAVFHSCMVRF